MTTYLLHLLSAPNYWLWLYKILDIIGLITNIRVKVDLYACNHWLAGTRFVRYRTVLPFCPNVYTPGILTRGPGAAT
jgi:hypothetical protein